MIKTINCCDRCGQQCMFDSIYAVVNREADAAGDIEDIHEAVDLCPICCRAVLAKLVEKMSFAEAMRWVEETRQPLKPIRL